MKSGERSSHTGEHALCKPPLVDAPPELVAGERRVDVGVGRDLEAAISRGMDSCCKLHLA